MGSLVFYDSADLDGGLLSGCITVRQSTVARCHASTILLLLDVSQLLGTFGTTTKIILQYLQKLNHDNKLRLLGLTVFMWLHEELSKTHFNPMIL